jgi:hypothetical protein
MLVERTVAPLLAALALAIALAPDATAEEVIVRNDSVEDGSAVLIQAGFVAGEAASAWLTSPCEGRIVAVQVFWASLFGGEPPSVEESIAISADGVWPEPGPTLAFLEGPVMSDGFLNEFRHLDEMMSEPIDIPVAAGERFVVTFTFANTPNPFLGPSVVTDDDGCQTPMNGIFAIPGGWLNPCTLGVSGDFFIRAVVDCGASVGACCFDDGTCRDLLGPDCEAAGGVAEEPGTSCDDTECVQACCFEGFGCLDWPREQCIAGGGFPQGAGTSCDTIECFAEGACCLPDGDCIGPLSPDDCTDMGGAFQGADSECETADCPQPDGACCFPTGFCIELEEADCLKAGAEWQGPLTVCDGDCVDCPADIDGSGTVDTADLVDLLAAWGKCPDCPEDIDGNGTVDVADLVELLAAWGSCE